MKRMSLIGLLVSATSFLWAQNIDAFIQTWEVERIERILSSDEMLGRKVFTPSVDKAADFIAAAFKAAGLQTWNKSVGYRQEFTLVSPQLIRVSCSFDHREVEQKHLIIMTTQGVLKISEKSGYEKVYIKAGVKLNSEARRLIRSGKNYLVLVDKSFSKGFMNLNRLRSPMFKMDQSVIFVLTETDPVQFEIDAEFAITEKKAANVVGILPGKSQKDEYVVFSGHYDHLGVGKAVEGDSIYNGANDDASGITAVIMLAKYFKQLDNNQRTLVFAAFTAEEAGGLGSQFFSRQFDPEKVMAMFNIEMIGTESKWGKNSVYITGYEKSDMGQILQKGVEGTGFNFYPDPYPAQQLFLRSDNATLAALGVPAHTISTSKMDNEPHYHRVTDEIGTLDMANMTMIIRSIALSAKNIIAGTNTPVRIKLGE